MCACGTDGRAIAVVGVIVLALAGCGAELSRRGCAIGAEGCACTPNGGCDSGLSCVGRLCQQLGGGDAPAVGDLGNTGNGDGSPGDKAHGGERGDAADGRADGGDADGGDADGPCLEAAGAAQSGTFYVEPLLGDWPDCVDGCEHRYNQRPFDVSLVAGGQVQVGGAQYDGLKGVIDGEAHSPGNRADVDMIRVLAPAGTLVEVIVEAFRTPSCIDPWVGTFDPLLIGFPPLYGTLTQNDDLSANNTAARTMLAAPYGSLGRWFVEVYEAQNVLRDAPVAGGDGYEYVVRFFERGYVELTALAFEPSTGAASVRDVDLASAGDIHYYQFTDAQHRSHVVRFETDNPRFCGHIWQLAAAEGVSWLSRGDTGGLEPNADCPTQVEFVTNELQYAGGSDTYALVVTDALGRGSNSGQEMFLYSLTVSPTF